MLCGVCASRHHVPACCPLCSPLVDVPEYESPDAPSTTVLVTGATGRVGRVLVRKLLLRGYKVGAAWPTDAAPHQTPVTTKCSLVWSAASHVRNPHALALARPALSRPPFLSAVHPAPPPARRQTGARAGAHAAGRRLRRRRCISQQRGRRRQQQLGRRGRGLPPVGGAGVRRPGGLQGLPGGGGGGGQGGREGRPALGFERVLRAVAGVVLCCGRLQGGSATGEAGARSVAALVAQVAARRCSLACPSCTLCCPK